MQEERPTIIHTNEGLEPQPDVALPPSITEQLGEESAEDKLAEVTEIQRINEALVNIPTEFNVNGKVIKIKSKPMGQMVQVDRKILELYKMQFSDETPADDAEDITTKPEYWDERISILEATYKKISEILFYIINDNYTEPEFTEAWITNNIDTGSAFDDDPNSGMGNRILDAYNHRCSPDDLVKKMMQSKKL